MLLLLHNCGKSLLCLVFISCAATANCCPNTSFPSFHSQKYYTLTKSSLDNTTVSLPLCQTPRPFRFLTLMPLQATVRTFPTGSLLSAIDIHLNETILTSKHLQKCPIPTTHQSPRSSSSIPSLHPPSSTLVNMAIPNSPQQ